MAVGPESLLMRTFSFYVAIQVLALLLTIFMFGSDYCITFVL
jgi:hypothetical protein